MARAGHLPVWSALLVTQPLLDSPTSSIEMPPTYHLQLGSSQVSKPDTGSGCAGPDSPARSLEVPTWELNPLERLVWQFSLQVCCYLGQHLTWLRTPRHAAQPPVPLPRTGSVLKSSVSVCASERSPRRDHRPRVPLAPTETRERLPR